jgi:uncharacterized membrane protein YdjX (TVP38/TMEM64 family)
LKRSSVLRLAIAGLIVALALGGLLALAASGGSAGQISAGFVAWIRELGPWGPVLLAASYIPACLLFVPGSILTLSAGYLFGVAWGTAAVSIGSTVGATAAFLAGRTLFREPLARKLAGRARFQALDRAVVDEGFKVVLLARLSPILPFNLLNYAFGLTAVPLSRYVLASWLGMLPGTLMYVYLGATAQDLSELLSGESPQTTGQKVLFYVGLAATLVGALLVTRAARRAMAAIVPEETPEPTEKSS